MDEGICIRRKPDVDSLMIALKIPQYAELPEKQYGPE